VVRNISRRTVLVFQEGNAWGHDNVHLEVSTVNGRRLKKPLLIARGPRPWRANAPTTQLLAPGQSVVRDLWLHLPATVKFPNRKPTIAELNQDLYPQGDEYWFFPFPPKSQTTTLTMKAVFEVEPDQVTKNTKIWTGLVASMPADYQISWSSKRP